LPFVKKWIILIVVRTSPNANNSWGVTLVSRPKGSKNKKTLIAEAQLGDRIAEQKVAKKKLEAEERKLVASLEDVKSQLKEKRKELRTVERLIVSLQNRKEQADAAAVAAAQKQEIEKVVSTLINSGKDADEILGMLKK